MCLSCRHKVNGRRLEVDAVGGGGGELRFRCRHGLRVLQILEIVVVRLSKRMGGRLFILPVRCCHDTVVVLGGGMIEAVTAGLYLRQLLPYTRILMRRGIMVNGDRPC
jgi:hypothetical protein